MEIFERLPENEKDMICKYINAYASDNNTMSAPLSHILRFWNQNKVSLYHMLGDNFIISKDIVYERDVEQLTKELEDIIFACDGKAKAFYNAYAKFSGDFFIKNYQIYCNLNSLIAMRSLASNVYTGGTFELYPEGAEKPIKINHGCKCTRALGKIAAGYNLDGFEEFRILHSQCLNQKKLTGHLCLSIHPLDYMTMSDNDCGWTSCMSWEDYGCYRQGTVEMMNSPMVVVAYLTANDDMRIYNNYYWSNKKWRQLFIVDNHMIGNIKAYPYRNDYLTKVVLDWLKELAVQAGMGPYCNEIIKYDAFKEFEYKSNKVEIHPHVDYMYNDFASSQYAYLNEHFGEDEENWAWHFSYSGPSECMLCGEIDCDFENEGSLVGFCCEESYYCTCCGGRYYSADELTEVDGELVCEYCVENECCVDSFTEELHFTDHMSDLYVSFDDGKTAYMTDISFCLNRGEIDNKELLKSYFKKIYYTKQTNWNYIYYFKEKDILNWKEFLNDILHFPDFESFKFEIMKYNSPLTLNENGIQTNALE
jgi:hypothetical protein